MVAVSPGVFDLDSLSPGRLSSASPHCLWLCISVPWSAASHIHTMEDATRSTDAAVIGASNSDMSRLLAYRDRASPRQPINYANAADWDIHQATITRLYLYEERTLKEVKKYMEYSHGFFAT